MVDAKPDPVWLIEGVIPSHSNILMSGKAKVSLKTWTMYLMCLSLATGRKLGPFVPGNGPINCLISEAETSEKQTRARWAMLEKGHGIKAPPGTITFAHREHVFVDDTRWLEKLISVIRDRRIGFVVLDTLARHQRGDENRVQDMSHVMDKIGYLCDCRDDAVVSVMYLHHLNKYSSRADEDTDIDEDIRGSSAIAGFYDSHVAVRKRYSMQPSNDVHIRHSDASQKLYTMWWSFEANESAVCKMYELDPSRPEPALLQDVRARPEPARAGTARVLY
jgi:RecA-family ATPase